MSFCVRHLRAHVGGLPHAVHICKPMPCTSASPPGFRVRRLTWLHSRACALPRLSSATRVRQSERPRTGQYRACCIRAAQR
eukprot:1669315-Alexandrium_andersonii.AAC.1